MRLIFVDEAGTSDDARENCRIVAAVIVDADRQLTMAEVAIEAALRAVPDEFREGFNFHAEDIINNDKYRDRWRLTDRVNLLKEVMSIRRKMGLAISIGVVWKKSMGPTVLGEGRSLTLGQEHHFYAFALSLGKADAWIRKHGQIDEIAMVVCENTNMKKHLSDIPRFLRQNTYVAKPGTMHPRQVDIDQGYNSQDGVLRIERIRETVHFVGKGEDKMVWLADACAYGLKRYFNRAQFGEDYCREIIGNLLNLNDYQEKSCTATSWPS